MKTIVAVATYNEAENIKRLAGKILAADAGLDLLVVDDNSPDGTGDIADELATETGRVHVIHRVGKLGLGTATMAAVEYALANDYDAIVTMDADFSHDPKHLPDILAKLKDYDIVVGSRYIHGGGVVNWPVSRRMSSFLVNLFCSFVFRLGVHDYSGAYRGYRREVLEGVKAGDFISKGYSFQEEMLVRAAKGGARIAEVPIVFVDRIEGTTKANRAEVLASGLTLLRLGLWEL